MQILSLMLSAFAGELVVDAKVPVRVAVDGELLAEVHREGVLHLPLADGLRGVVLTVAGNAQRYEVQIGDQPSRILVGRTGVTVDAVAPAVAIPQGEATVRFRTAGKERLLVQVDRQRVLVSPGVGIALPLSTGDHAISIRNPDGTQIFARGTLIISSGGDLLVQIAEGRVPETSGEGLQFVADGG